MNEVVCNASNEVVYEFSSPVPWANPRLNKSMPLCSSDALWSLLRNRAPHQREKDPTTSPSYMSQARDMAPFPRIPAIVEHPITRVVTGSGNYR